MIGGICSDDTGGMGTMECQGFNPETPSTLSATQQAETAWVSRDIISQSEYLWPGGGLTWCGLFQQSQNTVSVQ